MKPTKLLTLPRPISPAPSAGPTRLIIIKVNVLSSTLTPSAWTRLSLQVEYAIEAIKLGSTAIAIRTEEGIVMAVEKRITSPLMEPSSMDKIMEAGAYSFTSELNLSNSRTPS